MSDEPSQPEHEEGPEPPGDELMALGLRLMEPLRAVHSPVFFNLDRIPETRPLLFVGNHSLYGVLDAPFLVLELYRKRGIVLRALGDHMHFRVPLWRDWVRRYGVVDGTKENCARLMEAGEAVLVFPGGAREATKRKNEKYKLLWQERIGFAQMAIRFGCTIQPFAALGAEDAYDIVLDTADIMASRVGAVIKRLGLREDLVPPLALGFGLGPIPRPERLYFDFAEPVSTDDLAGREDDEAACFELRDRVQAVIEDRIAQLRLKRAADPHRKLLPRLKAWLSPESDE